MPAEPCHFLIRASYPARVLSCFLSLLVTDSHLLAQSGNVELVVVLTLMLLLYPQLCYWICWRWFNSSAAARNNLLLDSLLVAMLVVINGFQLFASVSFISALALSTLIIARPVTMGLNIIILLAVIGLGLVFFPGVVRHGSLLTEVLCGVSIISYGCMVAYQGFCTTTRLADQRRRVERDRLKLEGVSERLRPYISPQIYSLFGKDVQHAGRRAVRKHLTIFFSDIEGFTEIVDRLEEETVAVILNEYLNTMTEIAIAHGGTVDKFMGDGIMVFFGDPNSRGDKQDAVSCVQMALEMCRELKLLRRNWNQAGIFSELNIRCGINSGYCTVGNFGSQNRMDYTAVGGAVNIASRLEGKAGRNSVLISASTQQLVCEKITCVRQQAVKVKGLSQPIVNYIAEGDRQGQQPGTVDRTIEGFQISLNPHRVDADEALRILEQVQETLLMVEGTARVNPSA